MRTPSHIRVKFAFSIAFISEGQQGKHYYHCFLEVPMEYGPVSASQDLSAGVLSMCMRSSYTYTRTSAQSVEVLQVKWVEAGGGSELERAAGKSGDRAGWLRQGGDGRQWRRLELPWWPARC